MMKKIEKMQRGTAYILCIALIFCLGLGSSAKTPNVYAALVQKERRYLVGVNQRRQTKQLEAVYESDTDISSQAEDNLEKNNMVTVMLTDSEAEELEEKPEVAFVEEDVEVKACGKSCTNQYMKQIHKKKENRIQENKSKSQWNMRMIHSDKVTQDEHSNQLKRKGKSGKKKIKVAVLDSGVDYWSDIDLAESHTLVPKEEEMSLLFMDGTGHGNSVAGLIAAKDNEEGITGVNPNAEIYSIRVLDNDNCSPISRIVEGIYMAIERNVDIINMSFGVSTYSAALEQAVKDAEKAGILMVAAAGNVGDKGVQYPAAFDEVIAVGSVDKDGNLASDSSTGGQVELVAPGELVMSTGDFGDVKVASGTSLAAPQVAGAAALLWEKDPDMPAAFIRQVLTESANCYGEHNKYGNGLLDVEYALKNYNTLKKQYKRSNDVDTMEIPDNTSKIVTFDETNCVEGNWSRENHQKLVPSKYTIVKKGARFPDENYYTEGMEENPWWHGYWQHRSVGTPYKVNYVANYIFATKLANSFYKNNTSKLAYMDTQSYNGMCSDFNLIHWKKEVNVYVTKGEKRSFAWGIALHALSDAFAHSTCDYDRNYLSHKSGKADKVNEVPARYKAAQEAVNLSLQVYEKSNKPNGTYTQFSPALKAMNGNNNKNKYKMINIYENIKAVAGAGAAESYKKVSIKDSKYKK